MCVDHNVLTLIAIEIFSEIKNYQKVLWLLRVKFWSCWQ